MSHYDELSREELVRRLSEAEALARACSADREALRQSEERFRLFMDHSPTVAWIKDADGRHVYVSKTCEERFGIRLRDWYGRTDADLWPAATAEMFRKNDLEVLARDQVVQVVEETVGADGSRRHWLNVKFPMRDTAGHRFVAGVGIDITERRRAEEEARQRLREIEDLYRNAPVGLCVLDRELRWVRINERLAEFNGIPVADHIGKRLPDLLPELAEACGPGIRAVLETGQPQHNIEIVSQTPAQPGVTRSWLEHLLPITDERGQVIGLSIVVEETTDRRRAEAALRESEERLRLAQESARLGVWEWDLRTGVVRASGDLEQLYGYPQGTSNGSDSSFADRVHPDDLPDLRRTLDTAVAAHEPFDADFRVRMPDGTIRWLNCKGSAAYDLAGSPERVFGVNVDITERKVAEEALREADHRKDEFLATLAHELRNPLVPIRNAVEILKHHGPPDSGAQRVHELIERQVQHLVRLIDDLLDVSRISRGKLQLRKERVPLAAVLERALEVARPLIERAGHDLEVSLPPQPIHLDADPVRLAEVFSNLLDNACKFTERGGRIRLSVACDGTEVAVRVADSGIGITPEHLDGIFDMFVQLPATADRVRSGLGIGLALTRGLVEMHGGRIQAYSAGLGKGCTFTVRLPVAAVTSVPLREGPDPKRARDTTACRVLVVDDHPEVRESLAMLLELQGHEVATARDGLEAVEVAEQLRPDLVLLDLGMPRLDGYGACRRLREQAWGKDLKIVALTGWGQDGDRRQTKEAGFDHHLVKPVAPAALLEVVAKAWAHEG
jgi:PAS domain S-box-containing protein